MDHPTLRLNDGFEHTSPELRPEVEELQTALNQKGFALTVDGQFGSATESAVQKFQEDQGLDADGIVGPLTWAALLGAPAPDVATTLITTFPKNTPFLLAELAEATKFKDIVDEAAEQFGFQPAIIGGIGSRESRWGLGLTPPGVAGTGDFAKRSPKPPTRPGPLPPEGGFGRGLLQIDFDAFEFARTDQWKDPKANILFGCQVLADSRNFIQKKTNLAGSALLQAAIAGYNCGPGNVLTALRKNLDVDFFTANRNYSKDVLNRAGWFQLQGWD